jgi:Cytidylate kinase-like family
MRTSTLPKSTALSALAERQMRTWALQLEAQQRLEEKRAAASVEELIHPYIAISRETGVDAAEIAQAVASECNWKALDRELVDYLAEHDHLSRLALDLVDERSVSWFHEIFGKWLDEQVVSQAEYVSRLGRIALLAAQHESTVFVGRGIQFILPRDGGLAVRIIAPLKERIQRVKARRHCNECEARTFVDETDAARAHFVKRYFHHDVADSHFYDLVINLEHVPRIAAVDLIVRECTRRHPDKCGPVQ